jgi:hypothetical protein
MYAEVCEILDADWEMYRNALRSALEYKRLACVHLFVSVWCSYAQVTFEQVTAMQLNKCSNNESKAQG